MLLGQERVERGRDLHESHCVSFVTSVTLVNFVYIRHENAMLLETF